MPLDPAALQKLLAMDDDAFWSTIRSVAAAYRISLPESTPPKEDLSRLRDAVSGIRNNDLQSALRLLNELRRDPS